MNEPYRSPKKKRGYRVNEELEKMRRFQRDALLYLRWTMWAVIIIAVVGVGIFVRLLLLS